MRGRRALLAAILLLAGGVPAVPAKTLDRGDGIETQDWFRNDSFFDLRDELAEAKAAGRMVALVWQQEGCPACAGLNAVTLADPEVQAYISAGFSVLALNRRGEIEVVDFDGEKLPEKALAAKTHVSYTPTTVIYDGTGREVARQQGYAEACQYLAAFIYAREAGPDAPSLGAWIRKNYEKVVSRCQRKQ